MEKMKKFLVRWDIRRYKSAQQIDGKMVSTWDVFANDVNLLRNLRTKFIGVKEENDGIAPEFPFWLCGVLYSSQRAINSLSEILRESCIVFDVPCDNEDYFAVVPKIGYDIFDDQRSDVARFGSDSTEREDISWVRTVRIKHSIEITSDIFRLVGPPSVSSQIIVSERFVDLYNSNDLSGLRFKLLE